MSKNDVNEGRLSPILEEIIKVRGFKTLPSFYASMKKYPRLTRQFWAVLKATAEPGHIDSKTKEMIALAVCIVLNARYCIDAHISMAKQLGLSDEEFEEILMIVSAYSQTAMICSALNPQYNPNEYA